MIINIQKSEDTDNAARQFSKEVLSSPALSPDTPRVVAFYGKMGAGKTTFIKSLCKVLGSDDVVTSPTFAIVNEYTDGKGKPIYHFDFYRIKNITEVYDMGYEDYFYSGNLCLIEWPELIEDLLPEEALHVNITAREDDSRVLEIIETRH